MRISPSQALINLQKKYVRLAKLIAYGVYFFQSECNNLNAITGNWFLITGTCYWILAGSRKREASGYKADTGYLIYN
jgi:hypothetical protein